MFLLEDVSRPGEFMEATEDEHGTYIMNSKDLRAVQHVERLVQMGVHSLKIEGRTKSHYYVARTAQVYRKAIDDALADRPFDKSLMDTLESPPTAAIPRVSCAVTCTTNTRTTSAASRSPSASSSSAS